VVIICTSTFNLKELYDFPTKKYFQVAVDSYDQQPLKAKCKFQPGIGLGAPDGEKR
jgi:hypothetical protein